MTPRPHTSTLFPYTTLFRSPPGREALIESKEYHVTSVSRRLAEEAERIIPGGVNSATRNIGAPWAWKSARGATIRSEEHTSELQSRGHLVCRLLLEKKNRTL